MQYDKPLLAIAIGALSTIPYEIFTRLMVSLGVGKYCTYNLTSLIITLNRPTEILGMVVSFTVGSFFAFLLYHALKKLGTDYLVFKSVAASLLVWVSMEAFYVFLIEGPKLVPPRPVDDYYIHMIGSSLFGITTGLLFKSYLLKTPTR